MDHPERTVSCLVKTDVTAVKLFQGKFLLAGIGQALYIYRICDNRLIYKNNIFHGQRVHKIVPDANNQSNFAIFGGKDLKICNIHFQQTMKEDVCIPNVGDNLSKHLKLKDWIINLIWIKNSTQLAVLTAHNVVMICDIASGCIQNTNYGCEEKCILYCGALLEVDSDILVMGGTAFSQVVIWSTHNDRVFHRLARHKGVIFSVSYNEEKNIIISTSDDRSVRVWDVIGDEKDVKNIQYWQKCHIHLKVTLFGHTARVMQHQCVDDYIISIGEDTILCTWNLKGELINKRKVCPSGVLWCVDCSSQNKMIAIGGGDSGITILPLVTGENETIRTLSFHNEKLSAKRIVLTARGNIVCVTEDGSVLYFNSQYDTWNEVHKISTDKSYLCVSVCKQFVAVASMGGYLNVFIESCKNDATLSLYMSQDLVTQGKIFSVHWVYDRHLVVCDESGTVTVWGPQGMNLCVQVMSFQLPKSKQKWLTAAALDPHHKQILIVGSRCGALHIFKKGNPNTIQSINKLHGSIGINMIEFHENKIITAGRNGLIKIMMLHSYEGDVRLSHMYNIKVPFEWIEKFVDRDRNIICGFKETNLIVWDTKYCSQIVDINCGGGHRSWDLMKSWLQFGDSVSENILRFVYIKNSKVIVVDTKYNNAALKRISDCFHSKEINCCKMIPVFLKAKVDVYYCITVGEDTIINISLYKVDNITNVANISNHLSSIRCLCLVKHTDKDDTAQEHFLYTGGGRAQLSVTKIQFVKDSNNINCYDLATHLLKGTDLERKQKDSSWSRVQTDGSVEMRFMSINCIESYRTDIELVDILLTGCSDGLLRIYKIIYYDNDKCDIILDVSIDYHKKCILNVYSFRIVNAIIGVSLSVDGTIAFWDFTHYITVSVRQSSFKPIFSKRIHKAGVNAFDLKIMDENKVILASGGDDNCFHVNVLQFTETIEGLDVKNLCYWSCDTYHCSQITGVVFCENNVIVMASIDQRVTAIRWSFTDSISCDFIAQYCSCVPDIQGIHLMDNNRDQIRVCVFGKGLEIIEMKIGK